MYSRRQPCDHTTYPQPGLPGSSADLSLRAALNHPECSSDSKIRYFITGSRFHHIWRANQHHLRNEAESDLLALRLAGSLFEASPHGLLRTALDSFMSNG